MGNTRGKATGFLFIAQALFLVFFGLFVDYDSPAAAAGKDENDNSTVVREEVDFEKMYPMYQDIHVMMLIGFGFLMTFLKRHGFGSVGFNFLLTCYVIEWATLVNGWFGMIGGTDGKIYINIFKLMEADFAVAAVLISFGAVLGKTSPIQLLFMATIEIVFYNLAIYVGINILGAIDIGGSIFIHAFGAYFGLAVSRVLYQTQQTTNKKEGSEYHSDLFAMIGTLFLWLYWPSFNAGPAEGNERHRAVINTVLSLAACTVVTFAISSVTDKKNKLDMVHIQNATLAGGVAMGASANLIVHPFGALLTGSAAGVLSTLGYAYLQPILTRTIKVHDTCGVHNLHGMPGILGAFISAIVCAMATRENYKDSYDVLFKIEGRDTPTQGGYQVAALVTTIALALAGGAITGFILKLPIMDRLLRAELYDDATFWMVEDEDEKSAPSSKSHSVAGDQDEIIEKTLDQNEADAHEETALQGPA